MSNLVDRITRQLRPEADPKQSHRDPLPSRRPSPRSSRLPSYLPISQVLRFSPSAWRKKVRPGWNLARILNEYFGQLIDIIHAYGGDVVKFRGDAVIAVWPVVPDGAISDTISRADQWQWTMRATECALEVHKRLTNYRVEDASLYLKLAVSMGRINTVHVGGVFNRWEFLLTGTPLVELGLANNIAKAGEIPITPSAWKLIRKDCYAEPMEFELKDTIAQGGRLESPNKTLLHFQSSEAIRHSGRSREFTASVYPWSDHQPSDGRPEQLDRRIAARDRSVHQSAGSRSGDRIGKRPKYC